MEVAVGDGIGLAGGEEVQAGAGEGLTTGAFDDTAAELDEAGAVEAEIEAVEFEAAGDGDLPGKGLGGSVAEDFAGLDVALERCAADVVGNARGEAVAGLEALDGVASVGGSGGLIFGAGVDVDALKGTTLFTNDQAFEAGDRNEFERDTLAGAGTYERDAAAIGADVARQGVLEAVATERQVLEAEFALGVGEGGVGTGGAVGLDGEAGDGGVGERVAYGPCNDAVLREDAAGEQENQSARETISRSSSVVRTTGLPFMLLACAAFSTSAGMSASVMP